MQVNPVLFSEVARGLFLRLVVHIDAQLLLVKTYRTLYPFCVLQRFGVGPGRFRCLFPLYLNRPVFGLALVRTDGGFFYRYQVIPVYITLWDVVAYREARFQKYPGIGAVRNNCVVELYHYVLGTFSDVDTGKGIPRMAEHLLFLLVPAVHGIPV